jgi:hypothetical protein
VDEWRLPANGQVIGLCVDLNVWVRYLLAVRNGNTRQSAAHSIVEAARSGHSAAGPVQLIVSHTMLSRMEDVLVRLGFPSGDASAFCSLIGAFARRGPYGVAPHLVLGGGTSSTAESLMPVYNPYDPSIVPPRSDDEDGRVLDTAVAGRAHILATYNFADFESPNTVVLDPGRVQVFQAAHYSVLIMHADRAADYLRNLADRLST